MNTAAATASPVKIVLDGQEYFISPLKDRDYGEYERWVQDRYITLATRNINGLSADLAKEMMLHAYDKAANVDITSPEVLKTMTTIAGATKIIWLSLRHKHPDITEAKVLELLTDSKNMEVAMGALDVVNDTDRTNAAQKK